MTEPSDPEAERVALGSIILASPPWSEVESVLSAADFTHPLHRAIYAALCRCADTPPFDLALIRQAMREAGDDDPRTTPYLASLVDGVPKSARWRIYCAPVRGLSLERRRRLLTTDQANDPNPTTRAERLVRIHEVEHELERGLRKGLDFLDLSVEPEPGRWVVRNIIPEQGTTLLVAPSGVGKSWILEDLALAVATGDAWLGQPMFPIAENAGPIMIVDEESSGRAIHYRLARLARGRDKNITDDCWKNRLLVSCLAGVNVGSPNTWGKLVADVRTRKPCLVILDAAIRIIAGSENESEFVGDFWRHIRELQSYGAAVAVAHHTGWNDKDRPRGSADWIGGSNVIVYLTKTESRDKVKLSWSKVKDDADDKPLESIFITRRINREKAVLSLGAAAPDSKKTTDEEVFEFIINNPGVSRGPLLETLRPTGTGTRAIDASLARLKEAGKIYLGADNGYYPTEADSAPNDTP